MAGPVSTFPVHHLAPPVVAALGWASFSVVVVAAVAAAAVAAAAVVAVIVRQTFHALVLFRVTPTERWNRAAAAAQLQPRQGGQPRAVAVGATVELFISSQEIKNNIQFTIFTLHFTILLYYLPTVLRSSLLHPRHRGSARRRQEMASRTRSRNKQPDHILVN